MKAFRSISLLLLLIPLGVQAQNNKKYPDVPAAFEHARYVYVQAQGGDLLRPGLYLEDRQAISDVFDGLQAWNRYAIAVNEDDADLVFIVRKGRLVGVEGHGSISGPGQTGPPPQDRRPGQFPQGNSVGVDGEVGPPDDLLEVYAKNPDGGLLGPIWQREMKDGLEAPSIPLLHQLENAVERAYPNPPAKKQP